jgi:peptidoglycan-associated lipoprotein
MRRADGDREQGRANGQQVDITKRAAPAEPIHAIANTVHVDDGKARLRPWALPVFGGVAERRRRYLDVQIFITGHADERATRQYNLALGGLRATSVRNYLISLGIPPQRRATVSAGKEPPAIAGSSEATAAPWRRSIRCAPARGIGWPFGECRLRPIVFLTYLSSF